MTTSAQQAVMDRAVQHLIGNYSPNGQRVGWLMIASILVEAWDLYSIAFVLIFLRHIFTLRRPCSAWLRRARKAVRCSAR